MDALDSVAFRARRTELAVLDVRDEVAFRGGHLRGSGHVPATELAERRSELPARDIPLVVVADDGARAAAAGAALEALGYPRVWWLDAPLGAIDGGLTDRDPAVRLWRPSPFLEQVMPRLPDPRAAIRRALDLAAGAGREAVFLALQGYQVEAWDHDADVLERARALAARHGVPLATRVRDLERREPELPAGDRDLVTVFRFLHRPLFPHLERALAPGGWVIYETYLRGQERFGRPRHPRFLLDPGELPRHFPGCVIEHYEELTPSGGPFLARLLARRPG